MNDFSFPDFVNTFGMKPSKINFIKAGKRPMSSELKQKNNKKNFKIPRLNKKKV